MKAGIFLLMLPICLLFIYPVFAAFGNDYVNSGIAASFYDDFDRANNATVGGDWTEFIDLGANIESNKLDMITASTNDGIELLQKLNCTTNLTVSFTMTEAINNGYIRMMVCNDNTVKAQHGDGNCTNIAPDHTGVLRQRLITDGSERDFPTAALGDYPLKLTIFTNATSAKYFINDVVTFDMIEHNISYENGCWFYLVGGGAESNPNFDNFTLNYTVEAPPVDSCTAPGTGDWEVDCADECDWTDAQDVPEDIYMSGSGKVTLSNTFTFTGSDQYIYITDSCTFETISGGQIG